MESALPEFDVSALASDTARLLSSAAMAPRLREDLVANTVEEQGVACVEVADPARGTTFRFYDFEYALAQQLTGQPLQDVITWARDVYGIDLPPEALDQFLEKLGGLGFLEGSSSGAQPEILAPFSSSSGSLPFGDVPTTVAVDMSPLAELTEADLPELLRETSGGGQRFEALASPVRPPAARQDSAAPRGLRGGDPAEYGLPSAAGDPAPPWPKADASREFDRMEGARPSVAREAIEPFELLPKLEVLATPLPPPVLEKESLAESGAKSPGGPETQVGRRGDDVQTGGGDTDPHRGGERAGKDSAESDRSPGAPAAPAFAVSVPVRWPPPDLSALAGAAPLVGPRAPARENASATVRSAPEKKPQRQAAAPVSTPLHTPVVTPVSTPLGSIAHAIAASLEPAGAGAPKTGMPSGGMAAADAEADADENREANGAIGELADEPAPIGFVRPSQPAPASLAATAPAVVSSTPSRPVSWTTQLSDQVDRQPEPLPAPSPAAAVGASSASSSFAGAARAASLPSSLAAPSSEDNRRQPPPPEVVVMPPIAEAPSAPPARGSRSLTFLVLLLLLGAAGGAIWFLRPQLQDQPDAPSASSPAAPTVHAVSPQPTTFYRWFETVGIVTPGQDETLGFRSGGRIQEAMPPGTTFGANETIARLFGVAERELAVNRLRSRLAYFEQLRDSSKAKGAEAAVHQAEAKLAARRQELTVAQAALAELEIRPRVPGEIAERMAVKGAVVKPGAPIFRVRSAGPRAVFTLSAEDVARARALGFCRLETIPGTGGGAAAPGGAGASTAPESAVRSIDCVLAAAKAGAPAEARLGVDLVAGAGVIPGTQVRLASARYDGVFPVPRAALVREGNVDHVWVVSGGGRFAERRTVEVVANVDDLGLVAHGLAVGDAVVVDPPAGLKGGAEINVAR